VLGDPVIHSRSERITVNIRDFEGHWVGVMETSFVATTDYAQGDFCRVIAVSRGISPGHPTTPNLNLYQSENDRSEEKCSYEFVQVLWIRWEYSTAYRQGAVGYRQKNGISKRLKKSKLYSDELYS
jgi:hypothetical protein